MIGSVLFLAASLLGPFVQGKAADPNEGTAAVNSKGYDRASTYVNIDGAEIDAFNFNFVTQFPVAVGLTYPENAGLSLRVNLVYNSRIEYAQSVGGPASNRTLSRIRRQNPFGLGFDLSIGRIVTTVGWRGGLGPYAYVDSSGAAHKLAPLATGSLDYRTHDGSHIRAVLAADSGSWAVSLPDGTVQVLAHHVAGPTLNDLTDSCVPTTADPCEEGEFAVPDGTPPWLGWDRDFVGWHVTAVYSRAAVSPTPASYSVEYFGDDANPNDVPFAHIIKSITDQHGRTIQFEIDCGPYRNVS